MFKKKPAINNNTFAPIINFWETFLGKKTVRTCARPARPNFPKKSKSEQKRKKISHAVPVVYDSVYSVRLCVFEILNYLTSHRGIHIRRRSTTKNVTNHIFFNSLLPYKLFFLLTLTYIYLILNKLLEFSPKIRGFFPYILER